MHSAPVGAFADPDSTPGVLGMATGAPSTRTVLYGYIPAGQREQATPPIADPAAALAAVQQSMPLPNPPENPQVDELIGRVVQAWDRFRKAPPPSNANWPYYPSLYLILDLADWLRTYLHGDVYTAIMNGTTLPAGAGESLRAALAGITIATADLAGTVSLTQAIKDLDSYAPLVNGVDIAGPPVNYNLLSATGLPANWFQPAKTPGSLAAMALAALNAAQVPVQVPPELQGLIKNDPMRPAGATSPDQLIYVIRAVFEHDPCQPVLSDRSRPFVLAPAMDAEAPARKIRIQLPDVNQLRAFNRGVALEMPPSLRWLLDRVTPEMMKGDPLASDPGLQLGMICSFSVQIIFLVAFIVMFTFLILLNIVFWWLPFLKVCFPVPVPPTQPQGPAPGQQP
jgi:hypothetical protein